MGGFYKKYAKTTKNVNVKKAEKITKKSIFVANYVQILNKNQKIDVAFRFWRMFSIFLKFTHFNYFKKVNKNPLIQNKNFAI